MAQFNKESKLFLDSHKTLFEVNLVGDENGNIAGASRRYNQDAWGRPKSIQDYSIFSATWTHSVPARVWEEVNYDLTTPANK